MFSNFINKYMRNYFGLLFAVLVSFLLALFLYVKVYIFLNEGVIYEVNGKFGGVLILRGDSRKKKIILIERDGGVLRFSTLLNDDELHYLRSYKGDIGLVYQKSPFDTIWVKEINLDEKAFKRN
ncbi:hypothetical protein ORJ04_06900 [Rheinheimera baltica]|uniref:Uncharacterized protein n=1 Tax=Rheinheimera baltica TaxID=67576 RepID=A0ABT9HXZ1_9GAMM|nr:hypothetical protein [Rheinheimera baltica]MDP5135675.1 hypothetical protein [Rheinheimera baltica]